MEELLGLKFAQNGPFLKIFATLKASLFVIIDIFSAFVRHFTSNVTIFHNNVQNFDIFKQNLQRQPIFRKILNLDPQNTRTITFYYIFRSLFLKNGRITRTTVKIGRASPTPFGHHPPPLSSLMRLLIGSSLC